MARPGAARYRGVMPTTDQLREIATRVGVSLSTVYRVLNGDIKGKRKDNAEKAQQIRTIAHELGYRPNAAAKAMSSGRFNCVALLLSADYGRDFLHKGAFEGIQDALQERSMHLAVARVHDAQLHDPFGGPRFLTEWMSDGLLINYGDDVPRELLHLIHEQEVPAVWLNVDLAFDTVSFDDHGAAFQATRHVIQLGHSDIYYAQYHESAHYSTAARRAGYQKAMQEAGLRSRVIHPPGGIKPADRFAFTRTWLAKDPRPTAVVGYGPEDAMNVASGALANGLTIPDDLSIVAIHDEVLDRNGFVYTTAVVDTHQAGLQAVAMLLEKIKQPQLQIPLVTIPYRLVPGLTTAKPKA